MKYIYIICIFIISGFLLSCTNSDYLISTQGIAADWNQMQTVNVSLNDYFFMPSNLVFKKGTPYKLVIVNEGSDDHEFKSVGFFKAIATKKIIFEGSEIKAPYFIELQIPPNKSLDILFVPVVKGSYRLEGRTRYKDKGMNGTIVIE